MRRRFRRLALATMAVLSGCGRLGSESLPRAFDGPLVCGKPAAAIAQIQGRGEMAPALGRLVEVEANLTLLAADRGGFFLQAPESEQDQDAASSEAIFVAYPEHEPKLQPGMRVRLRGRVAELGTPPNTLTALVEVDPVRSCGRAIALAPRPWSKAPGPAGYEAHEAEWLSLVDPVTVIGTESLENEDQILVSLNGRDFVPTELSAPGSKAAARAEDNHRTRLVLDGAGLHGAKKSKAMLPQALGPDSPLRVDSQLQGISGVLEQRERAWHLRLSTPIAEVRQAPRPLSPPEIDADLRIVGFNVLNYFNGDGKGGGFPSARGAKTLAAFKRQRAKIVAALRALDADVIALMEIENDGFATDSAIADLTRALNAARAADQGAYEYVQVGDGPLGSDLITVGLLYRNDRVQALGPPAVLDQEPFRSRARLPLAQSFRASGRVFTVVANHFKSKGSCPKADSPDQASIDDQGCWNATRVEMARRLFEWIKTDPTGCGSSALLVIGDLNAYAEEDPVRLLREQGLIDLVAAFAREPAYSYQYQGASGRLDHALATAEFAAWTSGAAEWHINADESPALQYDAASAHGRKRNYRADPYRSSDHDPVLVGLRLPKTPSAPEPAEPPAP